MIDFETEQSPKETAAERDAHYFLGSPLYPFSFSRQCALQRLVGDASSTLENSVLLVYLCTAEPAEIERTRTPKGKDDFRAKMQTWADSQKITMRSHAGREVVRVADEIWTELDESDFEVKPDSDGKGTVIPNA